MDRRMDDGWMKINFESRRQMIGWMKKIEQFGFYWMDDLWIE